MPAHCVAIYNIISIAYLSITTILPGSQYRKGVGQLHGGRTKFVLTILDFLYTNEVMFKVHCVFCK